MDTIQEKIAPMPIRQASDKNTRRGGEVIADHLIAERVPYVFALCGHGNIGLLDALYDRQNKLPVISVHHEAIAGFMADAYFRVAHTPVATLTSCGPGSLNLPVALASAMMDSSAFLAITGNVATSQFNRGPFQETYRFFQADASQAFRPYVKRSFHAPRPEMLPLMLRQAFKTMRTGRYGPVHLDVPLNVFVESTNEPLCAPDEWHTGISSKSRSDPEKLRKVIALLQQAKRPLIVAGHGVVLAEASKELQEIVQRLKIPVINTPNAKGVLPMTDPLALGDVGRNGTLAANMAGKSCDVMLALGCRFDDRVSSAWVPGYSFEIPPTRLIQVDIDPEELGRNYPVEMGFVADTKGFLEQLLEMLRAEPEGALTKVEWLDQVARWRKEWDSYHYDLQRSDQVPIHPERLVHEMRMALPENGILLADVGVHHNWIVQGWQTSLPQTVLQSWGFASMGFAVGGALGAKLAAPDRPVVAVCGDGGFLMFPGAVATAVEYGIPVTWVVWNNLGYCSIREMQLGYFSGREIATGFTRQSTNELHDTNIAAMARAMGAQATRITHPGELGDALRGAIRSGVPSVVEVMVNRDIQPPSVGSWVLPPFPPARPTYVPDGRKIENPNS